MSISLTHTARTNLIHNLHCVKNFHRANKIFDFYLYANYAFTTVFIKLAHCPT